MSSSQTHYVIDYQTFYSVGRGRRGRGREKVSTDKRRTVFYMITRLMFFYIDRKFIHVARELV